MRTFKLTDDCTLSGKRLHRDERRVEGGGYVDLNTPLVPTGSRHVLLPAHGVVLVRAAGMKPGEKEVPPDSFRSSSLRKERECQEWA